MNLPSVEEIGEGKTVWLRLDLDLSIEEGEIKDTARLDKSILTINKLLQKNCRLLIAGHRGRPKNREVELSLRPVYLELLERLKGQDISAVFAQNMEDVEELACLLQKNHIVFGENLRFWPGEMENDRELVSGWGNLVDVVVNEAIAAYRPAASVTGIAGEKPLFFGPNFIEQYELMKEIKEGAKKPIILILGGIKRDKLEFLERLANWADRILLGGLLPKYLKKTSEKVLCAKLTASEEDISPDSLLEWLGELSLAKTVVWAGPLGKIEGEGGQTASRRIAETLDCEEKMVVIAGGDTEAFLKKEGRGNKYWKKILGGGSFLYFLAHNRLPILELVKKG